MVTFKITIKKQKTNIKFFSYCRSSYMCTIFHPNPSMLFVVR